MWKSGEVLKVEESRVNGEVRRIEGSGGGVEYDYHIWNEGQSMNYVSRERNTEHT